MSKFKENGCQIRNMDLKIIQHVSQVWTTTANNESNAAAEMSSLDQ
jgi:hypothetical protein